MSHTNTASFNPNSRVLSCPLPLRVCVSFTQSETQTQLQDTGPPAQSHDIRKTVSELLQPCFVKNTLNKKNSRFISSFFPLECS